ncbi:MAG: rRNA maturation RNase YbeY, partial [Mycobacteriales bacterium]
VALARHALEEMNVSPMAELSMLLIDIEHMSELNQRWMDSSGPTDVLAFPMDEFDTDRGPGHVPGDTMALLGDVVLCPAIAEQQARRAGHSTADELHLLTVHGVLHLLGYDHADPEEEREMFALQNRLLRTWRSATP